MDEITEQAAKLQGLLNKTQEIMSSNNSVIMSEVQSCFFFCFCVFFLFVILEVAVPFALRLCDCVYMCGYVLYICAGWGKYQKKKWLQNIKGCITINEKI